MTEGRSALEQLVASEPYRGWASDPAHAIDARKITAELAGERRTMPGSAYARALVRLARLFPPGPAPATLDPLWQRDLVFTRTLSSFHGQLRDAARAAGFSVVLVQLDHTPYADANRAELSAIGSGLRAQGWKLAGWATYGYEDETVSHDPRADGARHAALRRELQLDGWVANGELWAETGRAWKTAAYLDGWRLGGGTGPLAVSCLSSTVSGWARAFDYASWLAVPGAAVMPQVYGASDAGYTVANCLDTLRRGGVPTDRLALTFDVIAGVGPFPDYRTWPGPRSVWTGDDSTVDTWKALAR